MTFHLVIPILGVGYKSALILIPFYSCVILILWSYYQAVFTEPGIVDMDVVRLSVFKGLKKGIQMQSIIIDARSGVRCNCIKPFRAHHCRRCQKCILKMDHHCPWISNCVGARNQKPFMLFLLYVSIGETIAIIMTIMYCRFYSSKFKRYFHWLPLEYIFTGLYKKPKLLKFFHRWHIAFPFFENELNTQIFVCIQVIFSVIFCVFCIILLYDQFKNVWYDRTFIEESRDQQSTTTSSFYESLVETMGEPFCLNWFLPLPGRDIDKIIKRLCTEVYEDERRVKED
ncbi:hypothetical protein JH06_0512 [Blastocystis sp. subtype 4]|uniref:hypothetical protein n=1 Tax=Blastocystis sp. subtype 4 TaxID=944170 RepID=UPI0007122023|nr:hypothetical protein JH06_0512 [Blastocystis sp. subtype 4]KNB45836.1 hypothetical protein JH06_0512 [Blastocystis sp. subtype 4]|eukprot:XP_014529279.1 hypothetical protein JH06_0512 [Blastocystis sp. subtype 4]